jgi:hypothetical protein
MATARKLSDDVLDLLLTRQEESNGGIQDQDLNDAIARASTEISEGRLNRRRVDAAGRVKSWLESCGFALEMRVARILQEATGGRVIQGEHYRDPDTNELRETDLVLYYPRRIVPSVFGVTLVVECKDAREKPWVMLCSRRPDAPLEASVAQRPATETGAKVLHKLATENWQIHEKLGSSALFQLPEVVGFRLTQSYRSRQSRDDAAHSALMSLTAASWGVLKPIEHYVDDAAFLAWPVLVIGGVLFQAYLEDTGEIAIRQVDEATLAWRNQRNLRMFGGHSFVKVVTERGLSEFVTRLWADIREFSQIATEAL